MIHIDENTIMIGATEFRSEMPKLMKLLGQKRIIVMQRGEPIGVFSDFNDYQQQENWADVFEDVVLGYLAKERYESSDEKDYYTSEEMEQKLGLI